uniref:Uncharacterized protein n=1 Tax=Spongospora subterranea TaxID=70186 RepID=A0A0H5REB6_9EUKA|eukprot:CRZ11882.1 hypothetical protein [Spongospora subterranea]
MWSGTMTRQINAARSAFGSSYHGIHRYYRRLSTFIRWHLSLLLIVFTVWLLIVLMATGPYSKPSKTLIADSTSMSKYPLQAPSRLPPHPYLIFGMPTTHRKVDLLNPTLDAIDGQLSLDHSDPMFRRITVLIVKNGEEHPSFDRARERFKGRPDFIFETSRNSSDDADDRSEIGVSWKVQQHTRDIASMMKIAVKFRPSYFVFIEDDFSVCPSGLEAILHLLKKAYRFFPNWIALAMSTGMNGIILKKQDMIPFAKYLVDHQTRRPPDHLIIEWFAGETRESAAYRQGRPHLTFRYNLMQHRGAASTLRDHPAQIVDDCYDVNDIGRMFDVMSFKAIDCGHDDIWPCPTFNSSVPASVWTPPVLQRSSVH